MNLDAIGCSVMFGATGGLGSAIARLMSREGKPQVLIYKSRNDVAEQLVEELKAGGAFAVARQCDPCIRQSFLHERSSHSRRWWA